MFLSQRGQTVLEYLIIATIIMAGIVVGGPFLAKSVAAHFRLLEDSTVDSAGEDIRQAPAPNPPAGGCLCGDWFVGGCGSNDPCTPSQRIYTRSCNPPDCDIVQKCVAVADCCTDPVMVQCGTILPDPPLTGACPDPRPVPTVTTANGTVVNVFDPGTYKGICPDTNPPPPNCKIWERLYSVTCGVYNPSNPSDKKTFYACKDVHGETLDCGPQCWDVSSADGTAFPGSTDCDTGAETSPAFLPDEIYARFNGFQYNGTTYLDAPPRAVAYQPNFPHLEMFKAYEVINTYFDPTVDLYNPYTDNCAPGQSNYGTAACHRCVPSRRCEFICPAGLSPMSANGIANATCKPCTSGQTRISIAYSNCGSCNWAIQYVPPPVTTATSFSMNISSSFQNWSIACAASSGNITNEVTNNCDGCCGNGCWNNPGFGNCPGSAVATFTRAGPCFGVNFEFGANLFGHNYYTFLSGDARNQSGDHHWNGDITCNNGNQAIMVAAHSDHCKDNCFKPQIFTGYYTNSEYKICTEHTFSATMNASSNASLYVDSSGVPGALIAHVENDAANAANSVSFELPRETSGISYAIVSNAASDASNHYNSNTGVPSGPALGVSNVTINPSIGTCEVDGTGVPCTNLPLNLGETKKLKFTYPAS